MADELTYSDIVEEVATPETAPAAANVKVYLNDGNGFLQMGLEDFEEAYNITDLRDRLKKGTGEGAVIEGKLSGLDANVASGDWSHVEGQNAVASGKDSHAENYGTTASGNYSHAEGWNSKATAERAHAEGTATTASGNSCHAEGWRTIASGNYCHAEGYETKAMSNYSHAEGEGTVSSGQATHAEGHKTKAFGVFSHAEGEQTIAAKRDQHVFGKYNVEDNSSGAVGTYVEIVGNGSADDQRSNARTLDWQGNEKLAGKLTVGAGPTEDKDVTTKEYVDGLTKAEKLGFAFATCPTAEATVAKVATCSNYTIAVNGFVAVKFDYAVPANATLNINSQGAHEIYHKGIAITAGIIEADDIALFVYDGNKYQLLGINRDFWDLSDRIAKGTGTNAVVAGNIDNVAANGDYSFAEGWGTKAISSYSHSEGINSTASNIGAHAEGQGSTASGAGSHAEGQSRASKLLAHSEGSSGADGDYSHAEGRNTLAVGEGSHSEGRGTRAFGAFQHVSGKYNVDDTNDAYAEIIGNGSAGSPSNARTLDWNGNEVLAGKLTLGANPTNDMDAATKKMVDDIASPEKNGFGYAVCSTERAVGRKVATLAGYTIKENAYVSVKFANEIVGFGSNWSSLNINGQGAHDIYHHGSPLRSGFILAGDLATFVYADGKYHLIGVDSPHPKNHGFACGICNEAASETAKTVLTGDDFQLTDNGIITVIFSHAVPANSTLNVEGTGAIPIYFGNNSLGDGVIGEKCMATFMYHSNFVSSSPHWLLMSVQAYGTNA